MTKRKENPLPGGRPTSFRMEMLPQVHKLARIGATDAEIADFLRVSSPTFIAWKSRYPKFLNALNAGKKALDQRVVRALYHRAVGYTFESEKVAINSKGEVTRVRVKEHIPPSETAAIFWLKNRQPDKWRDKAEGDRTNINVSFATLIADTIKRVDAEDRKMIIDAKAMDKPK